MYSKKEYALYKGEEIIAMGSIREISEQTGKSQHFLRYMTYPIYTKRISQRTHRKKGVLEMVCMGEAER